MPIVQSNLSIFYIMMIGGIIGIGVSVLLIIYFILKFIREEKQDRMSSIDDLDK